MVTSPRSSSRHRHRAPRRRDLGARRLHPDAPGLPAELQQRAILLEREREQLARLAVHEERAAIARELHDIVAHSVTVMLRRRARRARRAAQLSQRRRRHARHRSRPAASRAWSSCGGCSRCCASRRRRRRARVPSRRSPSSTDLVAEYRERRAPVRLERAGEPRPLPDGVELSVYRIVAGGADQRAQARAARTSVAVDARLRGAALELEVVDDGAPSPAGRAARPRPARHARARRAARRRARDGRATGRRLPGRRPAADRRCA